MKSRNKLLNRNQEYHPLVLHIIILLLKLSEHNTVWTAIASILVWLIEMWLHWNIISVDIDPFMLKARTCVGLIWVALGRCHFLAFGSFLAVLGLEMLEILYFLLFRHVHTSHCLNLCPILSCRFLITLFVGNLCLSWFVIIEIEVMSDLGMIINRFLQSEPLIACHPIHEADDRFLFQV